MSCMACSEAQNDVEVADANDNELGIQPVPTQFTYVRVGNGNVLISGCDKHLGELIDKLRAGSAAQKDS